MSQLPANKITIPKNRSTGNLYGMTGKTSDRPRGRGSVDVQNASEFDPTILSPIVAEHEHGLGASGLRRIRQQPKSRAPSRGVSLSPSPDSSFTLPTRSASMGLASVRSAPPGGLSSPTMGFGEDLSRFPSESLHSFSFAHQSEDAVHNRQNLLKRSLDFMRERLGWTTSHPGLVTAQAKLSGDTEIQSMVELLARANVFGDGVNNTQKLRDLHGPLTGPANVGGTTFFDKAFVPHSPSSNQSEKIPLREQSPHLVNINSSMKPMSSQLKPDINSDAPAADITKSPLPEVNSKALNISPAATGLKRTNTDISLLNIQTKLVEVLARPYFANDNDHLLVSPTSIASPCNSLAPGATVPTVVHGHANRWAPAAQAIFTTEAYSPWTILAANDLACLVFGVTKAEVKKLGILEVVREDRRAWLEEKLHLPGSDAKARTRQATNKSIRAVPSPSNLMIRPGVTAHLLSKPSSRQVAYQKAHGIGHGDSEHDTKSANSPLHHQPQKSRGVLLCGDVVPIQKRNGNTGSASLWVKEKRGNLIWVLEEITEDVASLNLNNKGHVISARGATSIIWGEASVYNGIEVRQLIPKLPASQGSIGGFIDYGTVGKVQYYTAQNDDGENIPTSITVDSDKQILHVSSFPHIAGIMVLSAETLEIKSSNSVFSAALFGYSNPDGLAMNKLIPQFDKILKILTEEEEVALTDGIAIPEHSFRRARAMLALRDGNADAAEFFLRPTGLVARHRDGSYINVDIQMRVVRSERPLPDGVVIEEKVEVSEGTSKNDRLADTSETVFALWVTYSRHLHSSRYTGNLTSPIITRPVTPRQPSSGQIGRTESPQTDSDENFRPDTPDLALLTRKIKEATSQPISDVPVNVAIVGERPVTVPIAGMEPPMKKKIADFVILENMGKGAYGEVKLARYSKNTGKKVVLKYVTKRRILVDTWTRDRRLGTVPLEIHVLDYLRKDGLRHPNVVEMIDFFEDDLYYYIEMVPHGVPGMDLFDYIEMQTKMDEEECRYIFAQVVAGLHHLHTKAKVVHRDIKDENIIVDNENRVKLIDFGSAAYIKNGPFDVFVGTIGERPSAWGVLSCHHRVSW